MSTVRFFQMRLLVSICGQQRVSSPFCGGMQPPPLPPHSSRAPFGPILHLGALPAPKTQPHLFHLIHPGGEVLCELVDVVHQPQGQILAVGRGTSAQPGGEGGHGDTPGPVSQRGCRDPSSPHLMHAAGADVGCVHPRPRNAFVELKHLQGQRKAGLPSAGPQTPNQPHRRPPGPPFTFSLSSNIQKNGVMAPMSNACVVTAMMWLSSRVISAKSTGGGNGGGNGGG